MRKILILLSILIIGTISEESGDTCGYRSVKTRIIGGRKSKIGAWPWMAAIMLKTDYKPFCGGSLINERYVLTAAHCFVQLHKGDLVQINGKYIKVRLGANIFNNATEEGAIDFDIEAIKLHDKYDHRTKLNDLALVKLAAKAKLYTKRVNSICLADQNDKYVGELATLAGWGDTAYKGQQSEHLLEVEVRVWNNSACGQALGENRISDGMVCAGEQTGGKDSCQGDSGGPLMLEGLRRPAMRWTLIGVVSWGNGCGNPNKPGVYARVTHFLDWINANSKVD